MSLSITVPSGNQEYMSSKSLMICEAESWNVSKLFMNYLKNWTLYLVINSLTKPYLKFIMWSSWFPRFKATAVGFNINNDNKIVKTSMLCPPLSTKSPLNTYGLSIDGNPFCKKKNSNFKTCHLLTLYKIMDKSSNFPCKSPQTVTCLDKEVDKWTIVGNVFNNFLASWRIISKKWGCKVWKKNVITKRNFFFKNVIKRHLASFFLPCLLWNGQSSIQHEFF